MIRFMHPDQQDVATIILNIPQKREQKSLIGFLYQDKILRVFQAVDFKRKEGFGDYTLLHLLYDSGARASEIAKLKLQEISRKGTPSKTSETYQSRSFIPALASS